MKVIEARAILSADDRTAGAFKSVLDKVNSITKAQNALAKSGAKDLLALQSGLEKLNAKAGAIDGFKKQHAALIESRQKFNAARSEVERLGRAMREADKPTREMTRGYEAAQRTVSRASEAFRNQVAAVKTARAEMASYGVTLRNLNTQQATVERQIGRRASRAAVPVPLPGARPVTTIGGSVPTNVPARPLRPARPEKEGPGIGEAIAGGGAVKVAKDAILAGANVDSERSQMRQAGWTDAEIRTAEHRANRFAVQWGTSPGAAMNIIREARPTFGGDLSQTLKSVPDFFAVRTAMAQKTPNASEEELNRQLGHVIRASEIGGYSQDPAKLRQFVNFMTKMSQVHGSALRGEEIVNFFKSAKTAGTSASFESLAAMLPTMLPELGGDRLGTSLMTLRMALVGGRMKHAAAKQLQDLGLVEDGGAITVPKTGEIKGIKPGGIKGSKLLESNLPAWVEQFLIPAMDKKGIAPEDRNEKLAGMFSDRNAQYIVSLILNNLARLKKDEATVAKAEGIAGAEKALKDDPFLAGRRVKAGAENVGAAITEPVMAPLKEGAGAAADALNNLAEKARAFPGATATGGGAGVVAGGTMAYLASRGTSALWRLPMLAGGAAAGGLTGALGLPFLMSEALNSDPHLAARARAFNAIPPEDWETSRRRQDYVRQNPEGARAEAFARIGQGENITAKVESPVPVDVTGKVALDPASKVDVNVNVKVQGQATVTGQSVTAGGNAKGSVGTSTAGNYDTP